MRGLATASREAVYPTCGSCDAMPRRAAPCCADLTAYTFTAVPASANPNITLVGVPGVGAWGAVAHLPVCVPGGLDQLHHAAVTSRMACCCLHPSVRRVPACPPAHQPACLPCCRTTRPSGMASSVQSAMIYTSLFRMLRATPPRPPTRATLSSCLTARGECEGRADAVAYLRRHEPVRRSGWGRGLSQRTLALAAGVHVSGGGDGEGGAWAAGPAGAPTSTPATGPTSSPTHL